jgi:hypothetical protein
MAVLARKANTFISLYKVIIEYEKRRRGRSCILISITIEHKY